MSQPYSQFPQPQFQPQLQHKASNKMIALWLLVIGWICGITGALLSASIIGLILGIPLIFIAVVFHIVGIVYVAIIEEVK